MLLIKLTMVFFVVLVPGASQIRRSSVSYYIKYR